MASQPIANPTIDWSARNLAHEYKTFTEMCKLMFSGPYKQWCSGKIFSCGNACIALCSHTLSLSVGGGGSRMNGSLSRVKIYVQKWRFYFLEIMGRYCSTSLLHFCLEVWGMIF